MNSRLLSSRPGGGTRSPISKWIPLLSLALAGASLPAVAQRVYVADSGDDKIDILDVSGAPSVTGNIALPAGSAPRSLAISADGSTLAVGNFSGSVSLVDLTKSPAAPFATVTPGSGNVFDVAFSPDGKKVYVVWSNKLSVIAINGSTTTLTGPVTISTTFNAVAIAASPDGARVYVVTGDSASGDSVEAVDVTGATPAPIGTFSLAGGNSEKVVVSPDGSHFFVSDQDTNKVSIVDISSAALSSASVAGPPKGLAISTDGHRVYTADNGVSAIDVSGATPAVTDITIAGAGEPYGAVLSKDGATLYVTDLIKNRLTTIATASNTVTGSVAVGNAPQGVVFAPTPPPGISMSMAPAVVPAGAYSVLTVTLTNPEATAATIASLQIHLDSATDAYGLVDDSCGGTFATVSTNVVGITAGSLPAAGSCTLHIQTTSNAAGTFTHTVLAGDLQTSVGDNAVPATTLFTTIAAVPPTVSIAFAPANVLPGANSLLTLTLTNPNASDLELSSLTDNLPGGVVVASAIFSTTTCPGAAVTATAGASSFSLTKAAPILPVATLPASSSCTASLQVTAATPGSYVDVLPAGAVQAFTISLSLPGIVAGSVADNSVSAATATLVVTGLFTQPAPALDQRGIAILLLTLIAVAALRMRRATTPTAGRRAKRKS